MNRSRPPSGLQQLRKAVSAGGGGGGGDSLVTHLCRNNRFKDAIDHLCNENRLPEAVDLLDASPSPTPPSLYSSLLSHCLRLRALDAGRRVHANATASGLTPGIFLSNRLIDLYSKCGALHDARRVFDAMPDRDACSYNTLISGYASTGDLDEARCLFDLMPCRDHFSWSSIISGYSRRGRSVEALSLYRQMQSERHNGRLYPSNKFTVSSALAAATAIPCVRHGKEIHGHIVRAGLDSDAAVWSALSDMYAKCGIIYDAHQVFDRTSDRDVVSWTAMIGRYFDGGRRKDGFELFSEMLKAGVRPNEFTYAGLLDACSEQATEGLGRQVHGHMLRTGGDPRSFAASALVHMYSKCGNIENARIIFEGMSEPDLVSWTSIISAYAQNGQPEEALRYFDSLIQSGTRPDHITFVGVLTACAHAGLVDRGLEVFRAIQGEYGLTYSADHYACVVDLLSRAGQFDEAEKIIDEMPLKPDKFLWSSLLGGCRIHGNLRLGKQAAEALFELEPKNAATYVTLANIYASAGMWDEVESIRNRMDSQGVVKKPGYSWIEVKRKIHVFLVGDQSHPLAKGIYELLEKLYIKMKEEGYVPDINFVLHDVEVEQKEQNLTHHSEKLAVAFGILATPRGTPIKVFKNLRICGDCHTSIKFMSKIAERVIIIRDSNRFHHFKDGTCSCGGYW